MNGFLVCASIMPPYTPPSPPGPPPYLGLDEWAEFDALANGDFWLNYATLELYCFSANNLFSDKGAD